MSFDDIIPLASLALTPATILWALAVVVLWWNAAIRAWRREHRTESDWLIIGVLIGFLGEGPDNSWWGMAWTSDFIAAPVREFFFKYGPWSNLVFRQACTVVAAYCHVRAAISTDSSMFRALIVASWVLGGALALFSVLARG